MARVSGRWGERGTRVDVDARGTPLGDFLGGLFGSGGQAGLTSAPRPTVEGSKVAATVAAPDVAHAGGRQVAGSGQAIELAPHEGGGMTVTIQREGAEPQSFEFPDLSAGAAFLPMGLVDSLEQNQNRYGDLVGGRIAGADHFAQYMNDIGINRADTWTNDAGDGIWNERNQEALQQFRREHESYYKDTLSDEGRFASVDWDAKNLTDRDIEVLRRLESERDAAIAQAIEESREPAPAIESPDPEVNHRMELTSVVAALGSLVDGIGGNDVAALQAINTFMQENGITQPIVAQEGQFLQSDASYVLIDKTTDAIKAAMQNGGVDQQELQAIAQVLKDNIKQEDITNADQGFDKAQAGLARDALKSIEMQEGAAR